MTTCKCGGKTVRVNTPKGRKAPRKVAKKVPAKKVPPRKAAPVKSRASRIATRKATKAAKAKAGGCKCTS